MRKNPVSSEYAKHSRNTRLGKQGYNKRIRQVAKNTLRIGNKTVEVPICLPVVVIPARFVCSNTLTLGAK